jgi:hypothetical protein
VAALKEGFPNADHTSMEAGLYSRHNGGGNRWFAIGRSGGQDARRAGDEAAARALERDNAKLLVVFCSDSYDLKDLLAGINDRSGGVPLIGCSTAGEISTGGPDDTSVVVSAFGGDFSVATAATTGASAHLYEAGAKAAACIEKSDDKPERILIMLTDGLAGDQQQIVRGAYSVVGAGVRLVGGCAGDDLKMKATFQLHGNDVLSDAVVAAAVSSDAPFGIGVRHGWRRVGDPMLITRSSNNRVHTIENRPALDVYLERLDAPDQVRSDPASFTRFAQTHPLGLKTRAGEERVRFIGDADFDDRSLGCIAEVPQGGLAWFMEGDDQSVLAATDAACVDALATLGDHAPLGVVAFDCIARRGILGDEGIQTEIARIASNAGGAPVAGFYTYGEIARTQGVSGFHNQTLVVLAVS